MSEGKQYSIEQLVEVYVKVRDQKTELQATIKDKVKELNDLLGVLEQELLSRADAQGVESFKTGAGTAFLKETAAATVKDWDAFVHDACKITAGSILVELQSEIKSRDIITEGSVAKLIYEHFPIQFFKRDVVKSAVDGYIEEHEGLLPPGIELFTKKGVQVRRAKG